MQLTRRAFVQSAAWTTGVLAASGGLLGPASLARAAGRRQPSDAKGGEKKPAIKPLLEWKELTKDAKGNTVWVVQGGGGNTMVLDYEWPEYVEDANYKGTSVAARAAFVVDTKMTGYGPVLRRGIESRGMRVRTLLNTHHHYDHTGGNNAFVGTKSGFESRVVWGGVESYAHSKAIARILGNVPRYQSGAADAVRDFKKVDSDEARAAVKDAEALIKQMDDLSNDNIASLFTPRREAAETDWLLGSNYYIDNKERIAPDVQLSHVGAGHTDNDLLVFLPELNVLHTGDLLFNNVWPYIDRAGGCDTAGWIKSLERAWNMCSRKTIVIPGHGEVTDREAIKRQIDFFKDMRERAAKAVAAGTSREEFLKLEPTEYKDYLLADWIKPITLGGLWDEAKGVKVE
ncbi:MAG: MBL fold metallo-hydrolase [Planctomycetota bacterium]|nr:MBL fold metallo-hydrolase [Planctomycetota bacterium]